MPMLLDTSILVRLRHADSPDHASCTALFASLETSPRDIVLVTQVLIEYWAVATRPIGSNGLGLSPAEADADLTGFLMLLPCLPEPADVLSRWRHLVVSTNTRGRPSHDARLVAVMEHYGIRELVTLNPADFARFAAITCRKPADVVPR